MNAGKSSQRLACKYTIWTVRKKRSYRSGINRAPYKAMFGVDAKVGLTSSSLPDELISKIDTEEHLTYLANLELNTNTTDDEQTDDEQMDISEPPANAETCIVCDKPASRAHSCDICKNTVHAICGKSVGEEGFGCKVLCSLCTSETVIVSERTSATQSMEKQANRMISRSNKVLEEVDIGCNVVIPIPVVDRGKGDPRNVMAVVHAKSDKGYRLATKHGINQQIHCFYARLIFQLTILFLFVKLLNCHLFVMDKVL